MSKLAGDMLNLPLCFPFLSSFLRILFEYVKGILAQLGVGGVGVGC